MQIMSEMIRRLKVGINETFCAVNKINLDTKWIFLELPLNVVKKIIAKYLIDSLTEFFGIFI